MIKRKKIKGGGDLQTGRQRKTGETFTRERERERREEREREREREGDLQQTLRAGLPNVIYLIDVSQDI